nr:MAG: hypothetical protein [Caudoviricetes sp.]
MKNYKLTYIDTQENRTETTIVIASSLESAISIVESDLGFIDLLNSEEIID